MVSKNKQPLSVKMATISIPLSIENNSLQICQTIYLQSITSVSQNNSLDIGYGITGTKVKMLK